MSWRSEIHQRVLHARSLNDIEVAYREWAGDYEHDLVEEGGYFAPKACADTLRRLLQTTEAEVLDAGCGTGLVGQYLAGPGVLAIDGVDYSQEMLELAAAKGCYRNLLRADLNGRLDIESNRYSGSVCVGTFTSGHVGPEALLELIRVTASQGPVVFTVRDSFWSDSNFGKVIEDAVKQGLAEVVSQTQMPYIPAEESTCQLVAMRVS
jgi:SAM-dependent methyltransferase